LPFMLGASGTLAQQNISRHPNGEQNRKLKMARKSFGSVNKSIEQQQ